MPVRPKKQLTARSVVASTLLGTGQRGLPPDVLVAAGAAFAIAEGTVRVALSRMVGAGELMQHDGRYLLAGGLATRRHRQDESRTGDTLTWDGTWEIALVPDGARDAADRVLLRAAAGQLRLGELRDGVWLRPANLHADRQPAARSVVRASCQCLNGAVTSRTADARALAATLWPLAAWAAEAQLLLADLRTLAPRLTRSPNTDDLARAFTLEADVLRHLQHDPLLPSVLLPGSWPGPRLRRELERFNSRFNKRWREWIAASR